MRGKLLTWVVAVGCLSATPLAGRISSYHDFAQVGDGGGIRTVFLVSNDGTTAAMVNIRFLKPDGTSFKLTIDGEMDSSFTVTVPAGGMIKLETAGTTDPVQRGWARLISTQPVGAQALFEIRSQGQLVTQAAVESSGAIRSSTVFVDQGAGSSSGIAIANLSESGPIRVRLTLRDESGNTVGSLDLILSALGQEAKFISELFEDVGTIRGTLSIQASGRITIVALQQTGLVIGTLPPVI